MHCGSPVCSSVSPQCVRVSMTEEENCRRCRQHRVEILEGQKLQFYRDLSIFSARQVCPRHADGDVDKSPVLTESPFYRVTT